MSLTSGFYDSYNGDRVYDAEQFSSFLDGIIYDGVYAAVGNKFFVEAAGGMQITVDTGRAWFAHTWTLNSSKYGIIVPTADTVYKRIDAVVLEINKLDRKNYIKIVKGTPASSPSRPSLFKTSTKIQYALAYMTINKNATSISQSNITYVVGQSETPLVSALSLSGIPSGGKIGQVLAKKSSESGAVDWYDMDKLPSSKWYLTDGLTEDHVLGAFKFINQVDVASALTTKNEKTNYRLTMSSDSINWSSTDGFTIPAYCGLQNNSIASAIPKAMIIKFSDAGTSNKATLLSEVNHDQTLFLRTPYTTSSYSYQTTEHIGYRKGAYAGNNHTTNIKSSENAATSGIIGISWDTTPAVYLNGTALSLSAISSITGTIGQDAGRLIGMLDQQSSSTAWYVREKWTWNSFKVQYAIFYNTILSATQHSKIRSQIVSDAGS